jgi:hypothetical protein
MSSLDLNRRENAQSKGEVMSVVLKVVLGSL